MSYRSKRRRNYRSQRPYQITRYHIPNVLRPDELIMKIKVNFAVDWEETNYRAEYPVNGARVSELLLSHNFTEYMNRYNQIEFLSGKLSFYMINQSLRQTSSTNSTPSPQYFMMGMHTQRRWVDDEGSEQNEAIIAPPDDYKEMWEETSEIPGYSVRLVNYITSGKGIQKVSFKASKSSFKSLKANATGFQHNLPFPASNDQERRRIFPTNCMVATVDITPIGQDLDASTPYIRPRLLVSRTLLVKYKGVKSP